MSGDVNEQQQIATQNFIEMQERILAECFAILWKIDVIDELSEEARQYIAESEFIQQKIKEGEGPSLELRLTKKEYLSHLSRILETPGSQMDFLNFIVNVCYIMMLTEKNPLIAAELRGKSELTEALGHIIRR